MSEQAQSQVEVRDLPVPQYKATPAGFQELSPNDSDYSPNLVAKISETRLQQNEDQAAQDSAAAAQEVADLPNNVVNQSQNRSSSQPGSQAGSQAGGSQNGGSRKSSKAQSAISGNSQQPPLSARSGSRSGAGSVSNNDKNDQNLQSRPLSRQNSKSYDSQNQNQIHDRAISMGMGTPRTQAAIDKAEANKNRYAFDPGYGNPFTNRQSDFLKKQKKFVPDRNSGLKIYSPKSLMQSQRQKHNSNSNNRSQSQPGQPGSGAEQYQYNRKKLHESYEQRMEDFASRDDVEHFRPGKWEQKLLAALEKLEDHLTRPRGVAEIRHIIQCLPESALPRFVSLTFNPRKPMSNAKSQREVLFFLPHLANRFPTFEKLHRTLNYVLSFLNVPALQPAIARCIFECYCNMGGLPDNFPLLVSCVLDRLKKGQGRSLSERKGCIMVLQNLISELFQKSKTESIDWRQFGNYVLQLLKASHEMHDSLFVLIGQLLCVAGQLDRKESGHEYIIFDKDSIDYLIATAHKHLSAPSQKPNLIDERSHAVTDPDVVQYPHSYNEHHTTPAPCRIEEFSLTKDLAFACCLVLGHLARYYPNLCHEHCVIVLGVLEKDNLDLHRLTRGGNDSLRKVIKYCIDQWKKIQTKYIASSPTNPNGKTNPGVPRTLGLSASHHSLNQLVQPGSQNNQQQQLSQIRQDNLFSKKGVIGSIADGLLEPERPQSPLSPTGRKLMASDLLSQATDGNAKIILDQNCNMTTLDRQLQQQPQQLQQQPQ